MSTTTPFKPRDGVSAEWEKIYQAIENLQIGETVTYHDLTIALGREFTDGRGPFTKANEVLLKEKKRGLVNVRGIGYKVATASEHEVPAKKSYKRAHHSLGRSRRWIENTDRSQLSPVDAARFDEMELRLRGQEALTRRIDKRVAKVEDAVKETRAEQQSSQEVTEERFQKLQAALERAGITVEA